MARGIAGGFFYFFRAQPIEKARFAKINVSKKSKFTNVYSRLCAFMGRLLAFACAGFARVVGARLGRDGLRDSATPRVSAL
jgi:hypothetical protein